MNIFTISPLYNPSRGAGITVVIKNICEILVERGHSCKILTTNQGSSKNIQEVINGVEVHRIGSPLSKYLYGLSPEMYRFGNKDYSIWLDRNNIDIIHIHMYHNLLSLQLAYQLRNCGKPVVFTPHYNGPGRNRLQILKLRIYHTFGKRIFKYLDKVISTSEYEARLLQRDFNVSSEKIQVIAHGVNKREIKTHHKKGPNMDSNISLLFIGRLEEHKGVQYILKAMKTLKDNCNMQPVLEIVGDGSYKNHLVKIIGELGLDHNVIWSGTIDQEALWEKYENTGIFLLPSSWECYGLVVAEALASGTPAIVCDISALTEFVNQPGCLGIQYPPTAEKLASLIMEIHTNGIQVGPFDPAKIRTWDKVVDEYEHLYSNLISK